MPRRVRWDPLPSDPPPINPLACRIHGHWHRKHYLSSHERGIALPRASTVILTILILALLAGCQSVPVTVEPVEPEPEPEPLPEPAQVLSVSVGPLPEVADPATAVTSDELTLINCLYEGLFRLDRLGQPVPALAERIECSPDGQTWTFGLRQANWSDGRPITASDFRASWLRLLDPAVGSPYGHRLLDIEGAREFSDGAPELPGIIVQSDNTLVVRLISPIPHLPHLLALPSAFPVPPGGPTSQSPTSGPFRVDGRNERSLSLVRSDTYWDAGTIALDRIELVQASDPRTELGLFLDGIVDIAGRPPAAETGRMRYDGFLHERADLATYYLALNTLRRPLDDPRVRLAMSLTIDRHDLVTRVTRGGETAAGGFVPPGVRTDGDDFRLTGGQLIDDPDHQRARTLLAEAGFPGGRGLIRFDILTNASEFHRAVLTYVAAGWRRELRFEQCDIVELDWNAYLDRRTDGDFFIARAGWGADYPDPLAFLSLFATGHPLNATGWLNPDYDAEVGIAYGSATDSVRYDAMHRAERILLSDLPILPLFHYTDAWLQRPRVEGVYRHPIGPSFCFRSVRIVN